MRTLRHPVRWWIAPPGPDESLRSLVFRAAAFYERDPLLLWANLLGTVEGAQVDMDDPPARALLQLARAVGVSPRELQAHRMADSPWLLSRDARDVYCPVCRAEQGGEVVVQRRAWMGCLRTLCRAHRAPLLALHQHKPTLQGTSGMLAPADQEILDLIENFGSTLEEGLFGGQPWPSAWKGNPQTARGMLLRVCFNYGTTRLPVPISNVVASPAMRGLIHGPIHLMDPRRRPIWDDFRAIGNPAVRRAALWVVAWKMRPGLAEHLRPGWFNDQDDV